MSIRQKRGGDRFEVTNHHFTPKGGRTMKRHILITGIICIFCTLVVVAQTNDNWQITNENGDPLMLVNQDGSVGIGTENPIAKLDVAGDIALAYKSCLRVNESWSNSCILETGWDENRGGDFVDIFVPGEVVENEGAKISISENGNVGIGTNNPRTTLEVNGSFSGNVKEIKLESGNEEFSPDVSNALILRCHPIGTQAVGGAYLPNIMSITHLQNGSPGQILYIVAHPNDGAAVKIKHMADGPGVDSGQLWCTDDEDVVFLRYGLVVAYRCIDENLWIVSSGGP